jgi:regulation of enolase protein 1 (concanavalin A-like superfamily)
MITDSSNHLRLKRRGTEIYASFGPDGARWTSFSPLTAKLNDRLKVGISAINSSTKSLTAELEGFDVVDGPKTGNDDNDGTTNSRPTKTDKPAIGSSSAPR